MSAEAAKAETWPALELPGGTWRIDPARYAWSGLLPTRCRRCRAPILFVRTLARGKFAPIDPDGISHFATCPAAQRFRRRPS